MTGDQALQIVRNSIDMLFAHDAILITNDVSERAITHKLAEYIQGEVARLSIANVHVDCEYNRNLEEGPLKPKRIRLLQESRQNALRQENLSEDDWRSVTTFPDIIVHRRGHNDKNLLVIEVKKSTNQVGEAFDVQKLQAFTEDSEQNPYNYANGVFIFIEAGVRELRQPALRWFREGREV